MNSPKSATTFEHFARPTVHLLAMHASMWKSGLYGEDLASARGKKSVSLERRLTALERPEHTTVHW